MMWPTYAGPEDLPTIESMPLESRPLPVSTYDAVRRTAVADPTRTAIVALPDGRRWLSPVELTYGELLAKVTSYANALRAEGVRRRDGVALISPNVLELIPALLAAEAAAIAVPINPALDRHTVVALARRAGVTAVVASAPDVDPGAWALAEAVAKELELDVLFALRPTLPSRPPDLSVTYLDDAADTAPSVHLVGGDPAADDLAAFFHTGGTTGTPKLAAHTHRMQVVDAWSIGAISTLSDESTMLAALPLFHVNALVVTTLAPILRRMRTVWAGPLGYRDVELLANLWRIVDRYDVTAMSAVPSVYNTLTRVPVNADITSMQLPIVGAAPLPPAVREAWLAHTGVALCEGYGLTEATCATARSFPQHQRPGSVGQRLPYQRVAAVDIDPATGEWTYLPPGQTGNLAISGPTVFPGYVVSRGEDGPILDPGNMVKTGWLDTGDLGAVSVDGFISLAGRAKDLIIRGGHNIDPAEVEEVLRRHPAVVDAGVVGRPDQHSGEVPVAFVVVRDDSVDVEQIQWWAAEHVPEPAAAPKTVTAVSALPVTAVGKPYKLGLRILATKQELTTRLAAIDYDFPDDEWCDHHDGQIVVSLPPPSDDASRAAVSDLLNRYALSWRFR